MHGKIRTQVVEAVSSRDAFAELDARRELEIDETLAAGGHTRSSAIHTVLAGDGLHDAPEVDLSNACAKAGPFSEAEVNARELEQVADRHEALARDLRGLAARIRNIEGVRPV